MKEMEFTNALVRLLSKISRSASLEKFEALSCHDFMASFEFKTWVVFMIYYNIYM